MSVYGTPAPVATKVKWSTVGTYLACVMGLAGLNGVTDLNLVEQLPDLVEVFVAPVLPSLAAFLSGYAAKHDPRAGG